MGTEKLLDIVLAHIRKGILSAREIRLKTALIYDHDWNAVVDKLTKDGYIQIKSDPSGNAALYYMLTIEGKLFKGYVKSKEDEEEKRKADKRRFWTPTALSILAVCVSILFQTLNYSSAASSRDRLKEIEQKLKAIESAKKANPDSLRKK